MERPVKPKAPVQPERGPGGTAGHKHAKVKKTSVGKGGQTAWILDPADPAGRRPENGDGSRLARGASSQP